MCQWCLKVFGLQNRARRPSKRAKSCPKGPRKVLQTPDGTQEAKTHGQEQPDKAPKATKTGQEAENPAKTKEHKSTTQQNSVMRPPGFPPRPPLPGGRKLLWRNLPLQCYALGRFRSSADPLGGQKRVRFFCGPMVVPPPCSPPAGGARGSSRG